MRGEFGPLVREPKHDGRAMAGRMIAPLIGRQHALGHAEIDSGHQAIADWWARAAYCEPIQLPFVLARLKKLMRSHFDDESRLMQMAGGALCRCHDQEHQTLLELCDQVGVLSDQNWRKARSLLRKDFPRLVREHITCMDSLAVLLINTSRAVDCAG